MYRPADLVKTKTGENWKYNKNEDNIINTETIPGNMRPATNKDSRVLYPGNSFRANPLKLWRKQYIKALDSQDIVKTKQVNEFYDTPAATIVRNADSEISPINCEDCGEAIIPAVNITYQSKGHEDYFDLSETSNYVNPCAADNVAETRCVAVCDPEHKARMRTRYPSAINTNNSKPKYYTTNSSYLQARCRTYKQNNFQYGNVDQTKCGILNNPQAFRPNCTGCVGCPDCSNKISYYKPNNCKFAVQGAVSSSGRIARLKLDTINTFAGGFNNSNNPNFGPNVANAYAYSGRADAPFTVKSKMFNCSPNIGKFRRTGRNSLNCPKLK
jgi:hypothetical protein